MRVFGFGAVLAVLMTAGAQAAGPALPGWFPVKGLFSLNPDQLTEEALNADSFKVENAAGTDYDTVDLKGHHWATSLYPPGPDSGWDKWDGEAAWAALEPKLEAAGFKVVYLDHATGSSVDATLSKGEGAGRTLVEVFLTKDDAYSNSLKIVEAGGAARVVVLTPPGKSAETVTDTADFPYLTPLAGAKLAGTRHDDGPLDVAPPGADEPQLVGSATVTKIYEGPSDIAPQEFADIYAAALGKAGWTVTDTAASSGGGSVIASYQKNGRDLWAHLFLEGGNRWDIAVTDIGQGLLAASKCKTEVYGINFDFNKATLKGESLPVLGQMEAALASAPKVSVEIGGNTDNVGKPDYNLKLSLARAGAVKSWLVGHGIMSARLTTRGYGDTNPLVDNDNAADRARNRRVELTRPNCS